MASLCIVAPAKINLFLHIIGKRADLPAPERSLGATTEGYRPQEGFAQAGGYHLLDGLVAFAEFGDILEIIPADTLALNVTGPFAGSLQKNEDNLVLKAAQLLQTHSGNKAGAHIVLQKNIPVGAGLGGGSSDAAAALSALKKLWNVAIEDAELRNIALQLGSDVPVCLARQTAWMRGIGEKVTPITMQANVWVVLVNAGVPLLTADVFRNFSGAFAAPDKATVVIDSFDALMGLIQTKRNMLDEPAMKLAPVIGDVLAAIHATQGCKLVRMSGSGATCFGLYDRAETAEQAANDIKRRYPDWWSVATKLY